MGGHLCMRSGIGCLKTSESRTGYVQVLANCIAGTCGGLGVLTRRKQIVATHLMAAAEERSSACLAVRGPSVDAAKQQQTAHTQAAAQAPVTLTLAGYEVQGLSVAGLETCIILPRLKVAFDLGRCPNRATYCDSVFVSHAHMDHIGGLPFYAATRGLYGLAPPTVTMPPQLVDKAAQALAVFRDLDGSDLNCNLQPLDVGQELRLGQDLLVRPFRTFHRVPSQGYLLYRTRRKLKPHLQGRPQADIRDLKKAGEEVTDEVQVPEVAFTGDTTVEFASASGNEAVLRARLLIMEVTFIDDRVTTEQAMERGHTHLDQLVQHAELFQNEAILLIHFSMRYSTQQILDALDAKLPPGLRERCTPLLAGREAYGGR